MTESTTPVVQKFTEKYLTGYQFGDDGSFIGSYTFPVDPREGAPVHMPPRTLLIAPPLDVPAGHEAAINDAGDGWIVREEDLSWMDPASLAALRAAQAAAAMPPEQEAAP